ncbi:zinc-ribbon domain-containing protein [Pseudorhodobacter wandonensis]|uniref:zinc-ribbon domain-containing protein n=1 Tax=Pseudorhodobacter wandonensis TaxID=1120568 RepID=UPI00067A810E|nr:zinc-ribbon domain-containing protein [Pseudorhodobacter wandonensis]
MRLVCPNCDAQYELAEDAISEEGRDVQCSNCGHTWFQLPPEIEAEREAEEEERVAKAVPTVRRVAPLPVAHEPSARTSNKNPLGAYVKASRPLSGHDADKPTDDEKQTAAAAASAKLAEASARKSAAAAERQTNAAANVGNASSESAAQGGSAASDHPAGNAPPQPTVAPRRPLDDSLKAVLREEAERETAVRRSQTPRPLETQPDLGLQDTAGAAGAAKAVRDRLARLQGEEAAPDTSDKPTARRDLLPDIEEINSTLRASSENRRREDTEVSGKDHSAAPPDTGFRSGFSLMLLIAVVLVAAYVAAPKIVAQFPAAEGAMTSYVAWVDAARVWLDNAMRNAIAALQNLTSGAKS